MSPQLARQIERDRAAARLAPCPTCGQIGPCAGPYGLPTLFSHRARVAQLDPITVALCETGAP